VKKEISRRMRREMADNARKEKLMNEKKAQANVFSNKGGGMRSVAKKMRNEADKISDSIVEVKREDKSLRAFTIPMQATSELQGSSTSIMELIGIKAPPAAYEPHSTSIRALKLGPVTIHKGFHLRLIGPNGCGKTTVLKSLLDARYQSKVCKIRDSNLRIGYYSQDFSELDPAQTVLESLHSAAMVKGHAEQYIRHVAANFFLTGSDIMKQKVGTLSEGQKALLAFASLVLQEPGLLILDEPTNHINFRHLPAIAKALSTYEGGIILVSHDQDFVNKVKIHKELNLCTDVAR